MFDPSLLSRKAIATRLAPAKIAPRSAPRLDAVAAARTWHFARVAEGTSRLDSPATRDLAKRLAAA